MIKYKLTLEYDGTGYRGWQSQKNARTIQDTLGEAAAQVLEQEVDLQGAGRTDAGVHALGQVAHIAVKRRMVPEKILHGLNDILPANINILRVENTHPDFHARHDAKKRVYVYVISRVRTAFSKRYVWWVKDNLNSRRMAQAASLFSGFHDFASFADKRMDKNVSTQVLIDHAGLTEIGDGLVLTVSGSHFLWKMVRRIAGIIVEVGRGNLTEGDVLAMLDGYSELPARHTAPPSGLFLARVLYEGDQNLPIRLPLWHELLIDI
ncbi:MAG: tRNA pseudouridine synthase A [Syntrophus sp. SKADARSKE-3]|nr:tRNA pseudouridine synthase A [Syntrophus sp. SKADARSKE-3]